MDKIAVNSTKPVFTQSESEAVKQIEPHLQKYYLARNSDIISKLETKNAIQSIYDIIAKVMLSNGLTTIAGQEEAIVFVSEDVMRLVLDRYKGLTVEELNLACFNGTNGDYGETFGINLKTISIWIKGYLSDERKRMSFNGVNHFLKLAQSRLYTESEKEEIIKQSTIRVFLDYSANSFTFPVYPAPYYDYLKKIGLIDFSDEERILIYDESEKQYEAHVLLSKKERRIKSSDVTNLLSNLNENKTFSNYCKTNALRKYFKILKEKELILSDLITEKEL